MIWQVNLKLKSLLQECVFKNSPPANESIGAVQGQSSKDGITTTTSPLVLISDGGHEIFDLGTPNCSTF